MIENKNGLYALHTKNTTYMFNVMETGQLEHLYYGRRIKIDWDKDNGGVLPFVEKHAFPPGNTNQYDSEHPAFTLEDMCLEMSSYGKGDIREPFVEIVHADGSFTSDFLFEKAEVIKGKKEFETLPSSYGSEDEVETLEVTLKDKQYGLTLILSYYVYEACDVITRSACIINDSNDKVTLKRLMSMSMDYDTPEYVFTTFNGAWAREMKRTDTIMRAGKHVNSSYTGSSSNRANPFVMLSKESTSEDFGDCYGFNLIYSGNHYEAVEVSGYGKTRIVTGINPQSFSWVLEAGDKFEAPETVMTYSNEGFNGMSQNMHRFVREHVVRGYWKDKVRPVLLNSWEAAYFDINERKLLSLAKAGREAGIELFVMDDGWFGERNDDSHSLGDWDVNENRRWLMYKVNCMKNILTGCCRYLISHIRKEEIREFSILVKQRFRIL